jgi:hypothetical protein
MKTRAWTKFICFVMFYWYYLSTKLMNYKSFNIHMLRLTRQQQNVGFIMLVLVYSKLKNIYIHVHNWASRKLRTFENKMLVDICKVVFCTWPIKHMVDLKLLQHFTLKSYSKICGLTVTKYTVERKTS